ncbi:MAG: UDP-2,3-diacetamido-2,3-dideoxy-D-glucuronate 2-epimerase [Candidatus Omnitrophica bacterium]|nr:UDP-2,3-diacetamido-2,3-dideoxy-D-glucuronate 2-epimerase [Candidatus Omnitrophota bacterium]
MKVAVVLGTRPEIIKMSPVLRALRARRRKFLLVHTGQHYSYEMDKLFFDTLELPRPTHRLSYGRHEVSAHGALTGRMMEALESVLTRQKPDVVLAQGDTNTVLASALVASKLRGVRFGHVEAGLRSHDWEMPEEINRILADRVAHELFAPTPECRRTLLAEGIPAGRVHLTGNTIVDAVRQNLGLARRKADIARWRRLTGKDYFLMTLHRQENVDHRPRLAAILEGLSRVIKAHGRRILFPVHPRTVSRLKAHRLALPPGVVAVEPTGFLEFLMLERSASLILTDSGGLQEEACILGVPCVTLRTSTERPETVSVGANLLTHCDPALIERYAGRMLSAGRKWRNPFGDGRSGERIVRILERNGR